MEDFERTFILSSSTPKTSVKDENTLETSVKDENTPKTSVKDENTPETSVKNENTLEMCNEFSPFIIRHKLKRTDRFHIFSTRFECIFTSSPLVSSVFLHLLNSFRVYFFKFRGFQILLGPNHIDSLVRRTAKSDF